MPHSTEERIDALVVALNKLPNPREAKARIIRGTIECPLCKTGTIDYVMSDQTKRPQIKGRCSTPECLVFMS